MSNRTTVKSNIVAQNVPTVTNAILTGMLNTELADNVRFREDVAVIQNSSITSITVDFTGKDRVDLTRTGGALSISVSGIGDGEEKYLLITKTAGQAVTFVGVTDVTPVPANVNALGTVVYQIVRKDSNYLCKAWVDTISSEVIGLQSNIDAEEAARIIADGVVASDAALDATDKANAALATALAAFTKAAWSTATLASGWSGSVKYFIDPFGLLHVKAEALAYNANITGTSGMQFCTIPSGSLPNYVAKFVVLALNSSGGAGTVHYAVFNNSLGSGLFPEPNDYVANTFLNFYVTMRIDG